MFAEVQNSFAEVPSSIADIPSSFNEVPGSFTEDLGTMFDVAGSFTEVPGSFTEDLGRMFDVAGSFTEDLGRITESQNLSHCHTAKLANWRPLVSHPKMKLFWHCMPRTLNSTSQSSIRHQQPVWHTTRSSQPRSFRRA